MNPTSPDSGRSAVFLDRDGTLIEECHYLSDPDRVRVLPGVIEGLRAMARADLALVVVTNQSGIARGILDESTLTAIHDRLEDRLTELGIRLDAIYFCPHHPTHGAPPYRAECDCRKPRPGLFDRARADLRLNLRGSFAIGDKPRDILPLLQRGGSGVLITQEPERDAVQESGTLKKLPPACGRVRDFLEASRWVLSHHTK